MGQKTLRALQAWLGVHYRTAVSEPQIRGGERQPPSSKAFPEFLPEFFLLSSLHISALIDITATSVFALCLLSSLWTRSFFLFFFFVKSSLQ